jgi:hypothetical protein
MIGRTVEIVLGVAVVFLALRDVFDTVVVPGESRGALRVARRLLLVMLPVWKWRRRGKTGISTSFAPSVLMGSFVVWMLLLLFGFGLIAHALGNWFSPPADFEQALFIVGSALCTVGLSGIEAPRPGALGPDRFRTMRVGRPDHGGDVSAGGTGRHIASKLRDS